MALSLVNSIVNVHYFFLFSGVHGVTLDVTLDAISADEHEAKLGRLPCITLLAEIT